MGLPITEIIDAYREFSLDSLKKLSTIYDDRVLFVDPIKEIRGLQSLAAYFRHQAEGLIEAEFDFEPPAVWDGGACLEWVMRFRHRSIAGGRELKLPGVSLLRGENKIEWQRDYYDLGAMVYEHVPVIGSVIRMIKKKF